MSKMHTKTIQKIQKAYIKTYEKDVKIYQDIENSQGQGAFFLQTPVSFQKNVTWSVGGLKVGFGRPEARLFDCQG